MIEHGTNLAPSRVADADSRETVWAIESRVDASAFRATMRRSVGGVTIVTTRHEGRPWGMTVNAFSPVCMDPPTLLVCVNNGTVTAADIADDGRLGVNLLSQAQIDLSQLCSAPGERKFLDDHVVPPNKLPEGVAMPVLRDSLVTYDCRVAAILPVGTHSIVIATIECVLAPAPLPPLLYGDGHYMHGVTIADAATMLRAET